jgi:Protein of unknown function (DUF1761)
MKPLYNKLLKREDFKTRILMYDARGGDEKKMFSAPVNLWAIVVAAVAYMVVGYLWYSETLFGKPWRRLVGMKDGAMSNNDAMVKSMLMSFVTALVMSYILAHFIVYAEENTLLGGVKIAFWSWAGFVATMGANDFIYAVKPKSLNLYFINAGYVLVSLLVMGGILGVWQ